jgi:hypothetical protein
MKDPRLAIEVRTRQRVVVAPDLPPLPSMSGWPTSSIGTRASMSAIDSGRK